MGLDGCWWTFSSDFVPEEGTGCRSSLLQNGDLGEISAIEDREAKLRSHVSVGHQFQTSTNIRVGTVNILNWSPLFLSNFLSFFFKEQSFLCVLVLDHHLLFSYVLAPLFPFYLILWLRFCSTNFFSSGNCNHWATSETHIRDLWCFKDIKNTIISNYYLTFSVICSRY